MKKPLLVYLVLFSLAAVAAIFVLSLNSSSGLNAAIIWDRELSGDFHSECTRVNDFQKDFDVKGSVDYQKYRYNDVCYGNKLFQAYCASSVRVSVYHGYYCANGCVDGACLPN